MTIICIKDKKIAWDSQITQGALRWGCSAHKVKRFDVGGECYFAGGSGSFHSVQKLTTHLEGIDEKSFMEWVRNPSWHLEKQATLFFYVPRRNIIYEFLDRGAPIILSMNKNGYALGCGQDYAYGVMDSGKSAYDAVKMVINRFDGCGGPINRDEWKRTKAR